MLDGHPNPVEFIVSTNQTMHRRYRSLIASGTFRWFIEKSMA